MGKYQLVALDMDGTLLGPNGRVSDANRDTIHEAMERGVKVVIATGRARPNVNPFFEQLGVTALFTIAANGAEIWDETSRLLNRTPLIHEQVEELWKLVRKHDVHFWGYTVEAGGMGPENFFGDVSAFTWLKFGFQFHNQALCETFWRELPKLGDFELSNSHPLNIEVNQRGVHKGNALISTCEHFGLDVEQAIAIGDSLNDIQMLKAAGLGVAMENAQEAVKAAANATTASNAEDGVALAMRTYLEL